MAKTHGSDAQGGADDQEVFSRLWDLAKSNPEACRQEIRTRAERRRADGESLSIQLLGLYGLTILSAFDKDDNLVELLPRLSLGERTMLADSCEDGLTFIRAHWHVGASNPEFWATKIIDEQLGRFAVLLTELRPGRAEQMLRSHIVELPSEIVEMLDTGIDDDLECVHAVVSRHASQAPAKGAAARIQVSFLPLSRVVGAVTSGGLSSSRTAELQPLIEEVLGHIDGALLLEPQGTFYALPFTAFRSFALLYKGSLLQQANRAEEGLALVQAAVQLTPYSFMARSILVESLLRLGRQYEANEQITELRKHTTNASQSRELRILEGQASPKAKLSRREAVGLVIIVGLVICAGLLAVHGRPSSIEKYIGNYSQVSETGDSCEELYITMEAGGTAVFYRSWYCGEGAEPPSLERLHDLSIDGTLLTGTTPDGFRVTWSL